MNYNSEQQSMAEMVEAIGVSLEEQLLHDVQASPYYSIIIDEAIYISVTKQLGLRIQYLGEGGETCVKYLKLMELSKGTVDVITDAIVDYLTSHFIHTHCAAHRLSLAALHASSASKWVQHFESMLNQIYAFFAKFNTNS